MNNNLRKLTRAAGNNSGKAWYQEAVYHYISLRENLESSIERLGGPPFPSEARCSIEHYCSASPLDELYRLTRRLPVAAAERTRLYQVIRFVRIADTEGLRAITDFRRSRYPKRRMCVIQGAANNLRLAHQWLDAVVAWICAIINPAELM